MDLSKLNLAELKNLQALLAAEMKIREKSEIEKARSDINAIVQNLGLSLKQLLSGSNTKEKVRKPTGKVTVQYRNPQDSLQGWSGRGRQPNWVKEFLASGKNLQSAKVSS